MGGEHKRGISIIPRRNGKDLLYWNACVAHAAQRVGLYFYMAPYYNQVRQIIWEGATGTGRRFLDYVPRSLIEKKTTQDMRLELKNGSIIKLVGSDTIDRIVGSNPVGVFMTEFSLHKPEAWNYLRPILAENGGVAFFNGTPRGLNHCHQLFRLAEKDPLWFTQHLTRDDTGVPTLEAIENDRRSGMPESLIQQEYYCEWTSSSENTLIPLDEIVKCFHTPLTIEDYGHHPRILGVDPAYSPKGDQATIAFRQGRFLHPLERHIGMDNMRLATRIAHIIRGWHPHAVFIDGGRGEGVISRLWQLGYEDIVFPVHFSGASFSDLYMNKRAEIYGNTRSWIMDPARPLIPNNDTLPMELAATEFVLNDRGFIQLTPKKNVKEKLKQQEPTADIGGADAVAITFAEDVQVDQDATVKQSLREMGITIPDEDYDPLNYFNAA